MARELSPEDVERILEAWGRAERLGRGPSSGEAYLERPGGVAFMSARAMPRVRLPQEHRLAPGLTLIISEEDGGVDLHFEADRAWAGALLHCRWRREGSGPVSILVRLVPQGPEGRCAASVRGLDRWVAGAPDWARLDPRTAVPELFKAAWARAKFKPSAEELRAWVAEHRADFPPRYRASWERLAGI
jgi:hypothetical protein